MGRRDCSTRDKVRIQRIEECLRRRQTCARSSACFRIQRWRRVSVPTDSSVRAVFNGVRGRGAVFFVGFRAIAPWLSTRNWGARGTAPGGDESVPRPTLEVVQPHSALSFLGVPSTRQRSLPGTTSRSIRRFERQRTEPVVRWQLGSPAATPTAATARAQEAFPFVTTGLRHAHCTELSSSLRTVSVAPADVREVSPFD